MKKRVMVALSGGVDSAVAACLLKEQGYELAGFTMCLGVETRETGKIRCCGPREIEDAGRVCRALGIEHHVLDFASELRSFVIDPFIDEYRSGRTPNPCIECNRHVKFGTLLEAALSMGFDFLATGHYAGIEERNGSIFLKSAADTRKDQTYFLSRVRKDALTRVLFPLSGLTKDEVRSIAGERGLPVSSKPDSQDICFIPDGGMDAYLKENIDGLPGDIVDTRGNVVGRHKGLAFYTIGQRARLGLNWGKPLYVTGKDMGTNRIIVAERELLLSKGLEAGQMNLFCESLPERLRAKIRYAHAPAGCTARLEDGRLIVAFDEPQEAVTPGQTVALYGEGVLLASGIIQEALQ